MKNDRLSDALRRGDPAEQQIEAQIDEARKAALLARCAAEPFTEPSSLPSAAQNMRHRKTRWALPALAGAGALTAAALYGAAWFGANITASQTVPAQIVKVNPRPSTTPAPRKTAAPLPRSASSESVITQAVNPKKTKTRRDTNVADSEPTVRATKQSVSAKPLRQNATISPVFVKTIVRTNHKKKFAEPGFIANAAKSQAALAATKLVEPVVERVIIEQDGTPAENTPTVTSVAITMNGRAESVIVSRAAEPAAN